MLHCNLLFHTFSPCELVCIIQQEGAELREFVFQWKSQERLVLCDKCPNRSKLEGSGNSQEHVGAGAPVLCSVLRGWGHRQVWGIIPSLGSCITGYLAGCAGYTPDRAAGRPICDQMLTCTIQIVCSRSWERWEIKRRGLNWALKFYWGGDTRVKGSEEGIPGQDWL